jgi:hypothetical protein
MGDAERPTPYVGQRVRSTYGAVGTVAKVHGAREICVSWDDDPGGPYWYVMGAYVFPLD